MTEFFGVAAENLNSDLIDCFFHCQRFFAKKKRNDYICIEYNLNFYKKILVR